MIPARRAASALLGALLAFASGCHAVRSEGTLAASERARLYAAVLREVRPDSAARLIVVDSLLPTTDIEADQHQLVLGGLSITRPMLEDFLRVQRAPGDRFQGLMLPDAGWSLVSVAHLDSLRAAARSVAVRDSAGRGVRRDAFWQQWYRTYPSSGGYVVLSPASISRDGSMAMVHVRVACGPVCGASELRLMRRDPAGTWRTQGRVTLSES